MVHAMFKNDDVPRDVVDTLVGSFPDQPLDFFGAIRGRMYDGAIKEWTDTFKSETPDPVTGQRHVTEKMGQTLMANRTRRGVGKGGVGSSVASIHFTTPTTFF